jgi:hypothetical protein
MTTYEIPVEPAAVAPAPRKGLNWRQNAKGNSTLNLGDVRATVFQKDGGWRFCIASTAFYDQLFPTPEAAQTAAEQAVKSQLG